MYLIFNAQRTIYLKRTTNGNRLPEWLKWPWKKIIKSFNPCRMGSECHNLNCELYGHICNALIYPAQQWKYRNFFKILYLLAIDFIQNHASVFSQIHMGVKKKMEYFSNIWPYCPHPRAVTLYNEQWYKLMKDLQNKKRKLSAV